MLYLLRAGCPQLNQRNDNDHQAEHNGLGLTDALPGSAGAGVEVLINVQRQHFRCVVGCAAGQCQVLVKELEGVGQGQEGADGDGGHHIGNLNSEQNLVGGSAVNPGSLDVVRGDGLQTGDVNNHHIANLLPAHQHNHAPETGGDVQRQQRLCQQTQHTVEQDVPDVAQDDAANQVGHEENGAEDVGALDVVGQRQGNGKGKHVNQHRGEHGKKSGKAQGGEELGVLEHLDIVGSANPDRLIDGGEFAERQVQALAEGDDKADNKGCKGGQHKNRPPLFGCFYHRRFLLF